MYTKAVSALSLPSVSIGPVSLSSDRSAQVEAPIVDEIREITGAICTIFQRMNKAGDMLRVSTNVIGKDGKRVTGRFIPVTNPDGAPNPILSSVLRDQMYIGRAFVVDDWYVSAYRALHDAQGQIAGML